MFALRNIKKNEKFSGENIISLRPVIGIDAKFYKRVINKTSCKNIEKNKAIKWDMIK